ncbi:37S ribosomal protein S22 [Saxophila tyrrhenica]|uniref:37S ribosomal protein S22 n=1 Tax=Saxophila tyrrhenica TaxID=1690608 RepID=A0AAV9NUH2_9PEZI|nr:37S ribosomal protein S22 [Saxophila tyrrhenica]
MYIRAIHPSVCTSCRLRTSIVAKQLARRRGGRCLSSTSLPVATNRTALRTQAQPHARAQPQTRPYTSAVPKRQQHERPAAGTEAGEAASDEALLAAAQARQSPTEAAIKAREEFGDALPEGLLGEEALRVYERLFGRAVVLEEGLEEGTGVEEGGEEGEGAVGTGVLVEGREGLEEVVFDEEVLEDEMEEGEGEVEIREGKEGWKEFVPRAGDERVVEDINTAFAEGGEGWEGELGAAEEEEDESSQQRAHPLTLANRFGTSPSTLAMPQHSLVDPIMKQLAGTANVHLEQAAHRAFGGIGLPYSTSTPSHGKTMQQKPIGLDASQNKMTEMEADAFMATLVPGMYASIMSVLVETRKRLGSAWAEELVRKAQAGELRILDAGGAGAGILAVREMIRAEWERMHEENNSLGSNMGLAEADGKLGGASASPPLGIATVLTASDTLRHRSSQLLENTTFIPRLPDYLHTESASQRGKFDLILAPHTLWQLKEDHVRKSHTQNLWSLLSTSGGLMVVLEKGIPRGFELVAAARNYLLESRIASPHDADSSNAAQRSVYAGVDIPGKEQGMIVAPCTNHQACPMYVPQGMVKGRRDICHFAQRYVRPGFLQRILGARDKNWEDVKFSYIAMMRGRDLRESEVEGEMGVVQDDAATGRAFEGYGIPNLSAPDSDSAETSSARHDEVPHSLSLPRAVLPPLKRRGHVVLDLCTPSGTLERWTVPRSFSKQAFKDARKSKWGDIWALGAKTSVPRDPKVKKRNPKNEGHMDVKGKAKTKRMDVSDRSKVQWDSDEFGRIVGFEPTDDGFERQREKEREGEGMREGVREARGGLMRGRRVKGVRDKRDKKASGSGRRRWSGDGVPCDLVARYALCLAIATDLNTPCRTMEVTAAREGDDENRCRLNVASTQLLEILGRSSRCVMGSFERFGTAGAVQPSPKPLTWTAEEAAALASEGDCKSPAGPPRMP